MKIFSVTIVLILITAGCSRIPDSGYVCQDVQNDKLKVVLWYLNDLRGIYSKNDWVTDGISKYKMTDWYPDTENAFLSDDGYIVEIFSLGSLNLQDGLLNLKEFTFDEGTPTEYTSELPVWNYRDTQLNLETFEFQIYEYIHPHRVLPNNLINGKDMYGIPINITLQKKFQCSKDDKVIESLKAEFLKNDII